MNYIKQLQTENRELRNGLQNLNQEIMDFFCFLCGPKFTGLENGERKDWIATTDVKHFLIELRSKTLL